ncbi:hypothetical protein GCM10010112_67310 [Actinoplanes lobatus]|uniref:Uncharacterized protein n=1 Tax=Actinoplanes lobatus TaxID=113568 RepID=A0ABQ4ASK8_9ACTN|nr:hypothetical protein GCM10010112_67310 [Actinoplanes lobatus]GIE43514.1 hypothetical protein Alo02nite_64120 [Actinoplanes lobatus]
MAPLAIATAGTAPISTTTATADRFSWRFERFNRSSSPASRSRIVSPGLCPVPAAGIYAGRGRAGLPAACRTVSCDRAELLGQPERRFRPVSGRVRREPGSAEIQSMDIEA